VALDVGQGDALALAWRHEWWLLDAGPLSRGFDAGERTVLPFLRWAGVRSLAGLLVTHDDSDHAGGAGAVLRGVDVRWVGAPPACARALGARTGRPARVLVRGDTAASEPTVAVLWPPAEGPQGVGAGRDADNVLSLVLEIGTPAGALIAMGDAGAEAEDSVAPAGRVALLKVSHHGSVSASGADFVHRVHPVAAMVSVGARNRFGHPDPGVLARLREAGCEVRRTDLEGTLWFECSEGGVRALDWRRPPARRDPGARWIAALPRPGARH
jgi:competence protein ComEC